MSQSNALFTGPLFDVVTESDGKSFVAHAGVLSQCDKLKAIIDGDWKDSKERRIVLLDWDADTVGRLIEWLYRGHYSWPLPKGTQEELPEPKSHTPPPPERQSLAIKMNPNYLSPAPGGMNDRPLTPLANQRVFEMNTPHPQSSTSSMNSWRNQVSLKDFDFEDVMLVHAKVYCLADYMLLPQLQALAHQCLNKVLQSITVISPDLPVIGNLVTLIEYVYANTASPPEEKTINGDKEEPLRKLISTFIAMHLGKFKFSARDDTRMCHLLDEGGDFVVDLYDKVRRNTIALEERQRMIEAELRTSEEHRFGVRGYPFL